MKTKTKTKTKINSYNRINTNSIVMKKSQLLFKRLTNLAKPLMALALLVTYSTTNSVFAQNWDQINKIVASDRAFGDNFGFSVAISGDYAIVGTWAVNTDSAGENALSGAGAAYIFNKKATVGIVENKLGNPLTVYPNPTNGKLTIVFENEFNNVQLTVRNVIGQAVVHKKYSSGNQINLTLEGAAGVYFIEIVDGGKRASLKVIKE